MPNTLHAPPDTTVDKTGYLDTRRPTTRLRVNPDYDKLLLLRKSVRTASIFTQRYEIMAVIRKKIC